MSLCDRLMACGFSREASDYLTDTFLCEGGVDALREFVLFCERRRGRE